MGFAPAVRAYGNPTSFATEGSTATERSTFRYSIGIATYEARSKKTAYLYPLLLIF